MSKFQKGDRVTYIGDPVAKTTEKGTVMQFVPFGNHPTGKYEVHTDRGAVHHFTEDELTKIEK